MIRSIPPITSCGPSNKRRRVISADPVRFLTRGFQIQIGIGGLGNRKFAKDKDTWKLHIQASRQKPLEKCFVGEPPKYPLRPAEEIFENKKIYQVIIDMPHHQEKEIKVDIKEDILSVESAKPDFSYYKEFLIPSSDVFLGNYQKTFKNGVLAVSFEKCK